MKKSKLFIPIFIVGVIIWIIALVKQQISIEQYKNEIEELSAKVETAQEELDQNKEELEEEINKSSSLEYIEKIAREKLGMYLQNERVYVDSNM